MNSSHPIRVYDTSASLIPYVSQTHSGSEWRDIASRKWEELGLPAFPPPDPSWEPCYIRWGDYPEGGRSYNYQLQEYEPGVATFYAYRSSPDDYLLDLQYSPILAILYIRLSTSGRRCYRVYDNECRSLGGGG